MKLTGVIRGRKISLEASIALIDNQYWMKLDNGPSGFEHVSLSPRFLKGIKMGGSWIAYSDSTDQLIIPNVEMRKVLEELEILRNK